jgi:hypothetical protein
VLPHLRPLWGEWEDRWWPKALPADSRGAAGSRTAAVRRVAERPSTGNGSDTAAAVAVAGEVRP